jgi:hypothetical protein
MKQRGLSLELISQESEVELEVLKQFLPPVIKKTVETHAVADQGKGPHEISFDERAYTEETKQPTKTLKPQYSHTPTFLYCYQGWSNTLRRVNLLTGVQSYHQLPSYRLQTDCRWSELPGGSLLITGGGYPDAVRYVVKIDTLREYAVSSQPLMHTARRSHAAVNHSQYLYVLGGYIGRYLRECERYSCAETTWEVLPVLPVAGCGMSAVEVENSIYALGGRANRHLDTVQKLSLDSLTWELMQLKLPSVDCNIPCFKTDTQVILVIYKTMYSFTPLEVKPIKTLRKGIRCISSYYSRGTLYYEQSDRIDILALGI